MDSERFVHFHEGPRGICVGFSRHYRHLFHRFEAIFGPIWVIAGPFWDQHRVISVILDHFWVILGTFWGHFKIILTSFLGCFHIVLASFWGRFWDVFNPFFGVFGLSSQGQKRVILRGFGSTKMYADRKTLF